MRQIDMLDFNRSASDDFETQASDVINSLIVKDRYHDAVTARNSNDWGGLTYHVARALGLDFHTPVKLGLVWAVADAIDAINALEAV